MKPGWLFVIPWEIEVLGGVNRVVLELCNEMGNEGRYKPFILVADWSARTPILIERPSYTEVRYRIRGTKFSSLSDLKAIAMHLIQIPTILLKLARLYKKLNIKIVNIHYPTTALFNFCLYRCAFEKPKLVVSYHGSDLLRGINSGFLSRKLWLRMLARTDAIVFCSSGLRKLFESSSNRKFKQLVTIRNGVSTTFLDTEKIEYSEFPRELKNHRYLLCVGSFDHIKGQDILIEAFEKLIKDFPKLKLVLVGRSGELLAYCEELIRKYNLGSSIILITGVEQEKLKAFYKHAMLYVSPSRHESFGLCLLESAAMKIPIVASKTLGAMEIIEHQKEGFLVSVEDIDSLTTGIRQMLSDDNLRKKCADRLYRSVLEQYTWDNATLRYLEIPRRVDADL